MMLFWHHMHISNNIPAFMAWKSYSVNTDKVRKSLVRMAAGTRVVHAGDDPGGLAISERLRAQYRNTAAAASNVENKLNYIQTSDAWLQKIQDIMGRMSELAVMANDGTKSQTDRDNLQQEFRQMQMEIQRITSGATAAGKFNGLYLFRGGTGMPSLENDLVVGGPARGGARLTPLGNGGSGVTTAAWLATYNEHDEQWTIQNLATGEEYLLDCARGGGASIDLQGPNGYRLDVLAPLGGTYGSGDTLSWDTVAYLEPVTGDTTFHNTTAPGTITVDVLGTGEDVTSGAWRAVYDAAAQEWTVTRNGVLQGVVPGAPDGGTTAAFEGPNGFEFTINPLVGRSFATGDRFTWQNAAALSSPPVFDNASSATNGNATTSQLGTGTNVSTSLWRAIYNPVTQQWTVTNMTTMVVAGTINAAPDAGGFIDLEGPNGFRFTIDPPAGGTEYTRNDQFDWSNQGTQPVLGGANWNDNRSWTIATASTAIQGDGSDVETANWRATYDAINQQWNIRNMTHGYNLPPVAGAPNTGITVNNIGGANGFSLHINAPTSHEFTHNDRFDWQVTAYDPPTLPGPVFDDSGPATDGSAITMQLGDGLGVTTADWSATYYQATQIWVIRNETTGVQVDTISAPPAGGGSIDLEGPDGFRLVIDAPASGIYDTGDRFLWSNTAGVPQSSGSPAFTDIRTASGGSAGNTGIGDQSGVTTAEWRATYDAVNRQWNVQNLTVPANYSFAAQPGQGGFIDLEGPNGFRFTVNAPTFCYNTGDSFTWNNGGAGPLLLGAPAFTDNQVITNGSGTAAPVGTGWDVTTADWSATYNAVTQLWTIRNETTGIDVGTIAAAPNQGGFIEPEGADGFRFTVNSPGSRWYTTGDRFTWSNTRLAIPQVGLSRVFTPAPAPNVSATVTHQDDGYQVTTANWRATYDAVAQEWTLRNMTTGAIWPATIAAPPTGGGTLSDIQGPFGFTLTINPPASGSYSTGDYFTWHNIRHTPPQMIGPYYVDVKTEAVTLQIGPDGNQIFRATPIDLQAANFNIIGSYASYIYGSMSMTVLASNSTRVRWGSLIGLNHLAIDKLTMAQTAVPKLNIGIDHLSSIRAVLGAEHRRMQHTLSGLRGYEQNARAAESRIRDVDVARESAELARHQILRQIGTGMLAQANVMPRLALAVLLPQNQG